MNKYMFELLVVTLFVSFVLGTRFPLSGMSTHLADTEDSEGTVEDTETGNQQDNNIPLSTSTCGRSCALGGGIGMIDISSNCLSIKEFYDERHCCVNKECPAEMNCGSDGKCKFASRPECASLGQNYVCTSLGNCRVAGGTAVNGHCASPEVCCRI